MKKISSFLDQQFDLDLCPHVDPADGLDRKIGIEYTQCSDLAWSWEEFVAICQKLTTDCNGYDATNPNFDAEHITTYAVAFPQSSCGCRGSAENTRFDLSVSWGAHLFYATIDAFYLTSCCKQIR